MLEQFRDGFLGFFLVVGQWFSPGSDKASLEIDQLLTKENCIQIHCIMDMAWNEKLSSLVDAGIPLRFLMSAQTDDGDTLAFIRTLTFDISDYRYFFTDSIVVPRSDSIRVSGKFPQILIALRDYRRWDFTVSKDAEVCKLQAEMLPSNASRLNRNVDMTQVWGQRKVMKLVVLKE